MCVCLIHQFQETFTNREKNLLTQIDAFYVGILSGLEEHTQSVFSLHQKKFFFKIINNYRTEKKA